MRNPFRRVNKQQAIAADLRSTSAMLQMLGLQLGLIPSINDASYPTAFGMSAWVYACVSAIATAVGSIPLTVSSRTGVSGDWKDDEACPLAELLGYVSTDMDVSELLELSAGWLSLSGDCYWHLLRMSPETPPVAIRVLPADRVQIQTGQGIRSPLVKGYKIIGAEGEPLRDIDVVHIRTLSLDPLYGMPPVKPLEAVINTLSALTSYKYNLFRNGGIPATVLKIDNIIDEDDRAGYKANWRKWRGLDNQGEPLFIGAGWEIQQIALDPEKLAGLGVSAEARETIAGAFGVPPSIISVLAETNYNSFRIARKQFWSETVIPRYAQKITGAASRQLAWQFEQKGKGKRFRIQIDTSNIDALQEDKQEQMKVLTGYVKGGILTPNEARNDLGREAIEGGDELVKVTGGGVASLPEKMDPQSEDAVAALQE